MIVREDCALLVVDLQERLIPKIQHHDRVVDYAVRTIRFFRALERPVIWAEQYPKGLGPTVSAVAAELEGVERREKLAFGFFGDPAIATAVRLTNARQVIVVGVETHVCVLQTALGALEAGLEAYVVAEATGSRRAGDRDAALARMAAEGVRVATFEMALFETLRKAGTPEFKAATALVDK